MLIRGDAWQRYPHHHLGAIVPETLVHANTPAHSDGGGRGRARTRSERLGPRARTSRARVGNESIWLVRCG